MKRICGNEMCERSSYESMTTYVEYICYTKHGGTGI